MSVSEVLASIDSGKVKFIDLRFTDTRGMEQHVTVPTNKNLSQLFEIGKMFDGSSIEGWKPINESDLILKPDISTAFLDPFYDDKTLVVRCDIHDPGTNEGYVRDPRTVAMRAEEYLKSTGIADTAFFGPEPEFFLFDDVRFDMNTQGAFYSVDSIEGAWNSGQNYENGNLGHRPQIKGGYFPVPPVDSGQDIRSAMCRVLTELGMEVETHHHEVATAGQNEIAVAYNTLCAKADEVQVMKNVIRNVAHDFGKTATFMPKPLVGDNGSGMHCHISLGQSGKNVFSGDAYAGLSQEALYFIGGIIYHAKALCAFTNPTTNSYKRLVPGFEAPVLLSYSERNRSAAIRIPYVSNPHGKRIEVRFPDAMANPYFCFSALTMAGLDGIQNKIDPGEARDQNLYDLSRAEQRKLPRVASSLGEALEALDQDREFLLRGDVFSTEGIDSYIRLLEEDVSRYRSATHPVEFMMYYSG